MDTAPSALTQLVLDRLDKIEQKLEIAVRVQERQERHRFDINKLQADHGKTNERVDALEKRVDQAMARVHGGWAVLVAFLGAVAWLWQHFGGKP